jgi:hypothetical protein
VHGADLWILVGHEKKTGELPSFWTHTGIVAIVAGIVCEFEAIYSI